MTASGDEVLGNQTERCVGAVTIHPNLCGAIQVVLGGGMEASIERTRSRVKKESSRFGFGAWPDDVWVPTQRAKTTLASVFDQGRTWYIIVQYVHV